MGVTMSDVDDHMRAGELLYCCNRCGLPVTRWRTKWKHCGSPGNKSCGRPPVPILKADYEKLETDALKEALKRKLREGGPMTVADNEGVRMTQMTPEQVLQQMREDAEAMQYVADIVDLNADAAVVLIKRVSPTCPSDQAAAVMVGICCRMLLAFAHDMKEAVALAEGGEYKVKVLPPDDEEVKH